MKNHNNISNCGSIQDFCYFIQQKEHRIRSIASDLLLQVTQKQASREIAKGTMINNYSNGTNTTKAVRGHMIHTQAGTGDHLQVPGAKGR